jgi:hypothetical protein
VRTITNSDASRLEAVRSLMHVHPRLIVFYNFDYELELLRTLTEPGSRTSTTEQSDSPETSETLSRKRTPCFPDDETSSQNDSLLRIGPTHDESGSSSQETVSSTNEGVYEDCVIAEWNGHRHDPVPTGDRWVYLVQYTAGSEGWNCTTTDAMIFWSIPYSYKQWHQAFGRIDRMNTPYSTLYYYVLFSKSWIDQAIRRSLMAKKSFNESASGVKF